MSNTKHITKKQAFQHHGFFTPVFTLESGRMHVSPMRFATLAEALAWNPSKDLRVSASLKDFQKYYGHHELIG